MMQRFAEPDADRAGATCQHDAFLRIRPRGPLRTPAIDGVLEIAGNREAQRGKAHRNPVHVVEDPARIAAEFAVLLERTRSPFFIEDRSHAIEDCARRSGQDQEPEDHAEDMAMRSDQSFLDGDFRYFSSVVFGRRFVAPLAQQLAGLVDVAGAQGFRDLGECMAELAEAQRQVQHRDIPQPAKSDVDAAQKIIAGEGNQSPGQYGEPPRNHPLAPFARIEVAAQGVHIADEPALDNRARAQWPELLDQQREQQREERHSGIEAWFEQAFYRIADFRPFWDSRGHPGSRTIVARHRPEVAPFLCGGRPSPASAKTMQVHQQQSFFGSCPDWHPNCYEGL